MDEREIRERKAEKVIRIYNWIRYSLLGILIVFLCIVLGKAA